MGNDKNLNFDEDELESKDEYSGDKASRARNRTVMLSPEMTGEVRARFAKESEGEPKPFSQPGSGLFQPAARPDETASKQISAPAPEQNPVASSSKNLASGVDGAVWVKESPVIGFLVSYDANPNGQIVELRSGRIIVTSEPASTGNFIILHDESVSPMHAILRITEAGEVQVLDQLSEFGTKIKRFGESEEEELSGEKSTIEHGDVISFGNRAFHVCIIARDDNLEADLDEEDEES